MKHTQPSQVDYSRYFPLRQRAYLINLSEGRDREQFESLSGIIADRSGDTVMLQVPYATEQESPAPDAPQVTYKLTAEAMGGGLQILADLVKITSDNMFHLKLRGNMEFYQRRQTPRIDTTIKLFQVRQGHSLAVYRKEYRRIMDYMKSQGLPPNLKLCEGLINLSAGGVRSSIDLSAPPAPLSLFLFDLADGQAPVCAVAELVWNRNDNGVHLCGHRFLQIRKCDQERLNRHVLSLQKDKGITSAAPKTNWELLDRMTFECPEKTGKTRSERS